jgi:hypothetical protein
MTSDTTDLTCRELVDLVTDYFEHALSEQDRARFEQHLLGCKSCVAHLSQMRATLRALGRLREEDVSAEAQTSLLGAFRRWKASESLPAPEGPGR